MEQKESLSLQVKLNTYVQILIFIVIERGALGGYIPLKA